MLLAYSSIMVELITKFLKAIQPERWNLVPILSTIVEILKGYSTGGALMTPKVST